MALSPFVYAANLIGYLRVLLLLAALPLFAQHPVTAVVLYALGAGLDAVDGAAARWMQQTSRLGAVLAH